MASRLEGRVTKLERVANVVQDGCIIYYENAQNDIVVNADGDERDIFIGGDFNLNGKSMNIDEVNAHLMDGGYQAAVYLPVKRVPVF